jgi:hypothetical protein
MRKYGLALLTLAAAALVLTACGLPLYPNATATPTHRPTKTPRLATPTDTPVVTATFSTAVAFPTVALQPTGVIATLPASTQPQPAPANFCADTQATALIGSLKTALQTSDGALLASLVSPTHGMDARLYRDGTVVSYDQEHAKFLFETTFVVDWGAAPGSGLETKGSFHETIVPDLLDLFNKQYTLTCNQLQVGGTTYQAAWPYPGINFYSLFYPGSQGSGSMDWHTWVLGMHYVNGKPYLYAIMQFKWEP